MDITSSPSVIRPLLDPTVGTASLWEKIKIRAAARVIYGRHGAGTMWTLAVRRDNVPMAQKLLKTGFLIKAPGKNEWDQATELLFDSLGGDGEMTECLLRAGANPNQVHTNNYWDAPSHRAARLGNLPVIRALIAHGADPACRDGNQFTPALAALADFGHVRGTVEDRWAIAEAFVTAGADVKAQAGHGEDLLTYALTDGPERLNWALGLGLTLAHPQDALFDVLYSGLEELGAEVNRFYRATGLARDRYTENQDYRWDRWGMVDILVSQGASFAGLDSEGCSLLERGIERGHLSAKDVPEFVRRGAKVDVIDAAGNTLTHLLLTTRAYANVEGLALYNALRAAGLPDQLAAVNAAGQTPVQALEAKMSNWSVREANTWMARQAVTFIGVPAASVSQDRVVQSASASVEDPAPSGDLSKPTATSEEKSPAPHPPLRQRFQRRPPSGQ